MAAYFLCHKCGSKFTDYTGEHVRETDHSGELYVCPGCGCSLKEGVKYDDYVKSKYKELCG